MLTPIFKKIKIKDNKSFDKFCIKLNDKIKSNFILGEQIPETRIVREILISLEFILHFMFPITQNNNITEREGAKSPIRQWWWYGVNTRFRFCDDLL